MQKLQAIMILDGINSAWSSRYRFKWNLQVVISKFCFNTEFYRLSHERSESRKRQLIIPVLRTWASGPGRSYKAVPAKSDILNNSCGESLSTRGGCAFVNWLLGNSENSACIIANNEQPISKASVHCGLACVFRSMTKPAGSPRTSCASSAIWQF